MHNKEVIEWKNARILFRYEGSYGPNHGKIKDLIVAEFILDENNRYQGPDYLYKEFDGDIGNCNAAWDHWSPLYIFMRIFIAYKFVNVEAEDRALRELGKIPEFRDDVIKFFKGSYYAD